MKPGDRVRLKGKKRLATVVEVKQSNSSTFMRLGVKLDRPLCGFRMWSPAELEVCRRT